MTDEITVIVSDEEFARDLEWHHAMLDVLGMRYAIPTIPNPEAFRALFKEIRENALGQDDQPPMPVAGEPIPLPPVPPPTPTPSEGRKPGW